MFCRRVFPCLFIYTVNFGFWKHNGVVARSFEKTLANGTLTCAVDKPSLVVLYDQLLPLLVGCDVCASPTARCAWQCAQDPNCTNYNYRTHPKSCEFFRYTPKNCAAKSGCHHAQVIGLRICNQTDQLPPDAATASSVEAVAITTMGPSSAAAKTIARTTFLTRTTVAVLLPLPSLPALSVCETLLGKPSYVLQVNYGYGLDQTWAAYKYGFSDANGGYYIGNENIYRMTNNGANWQICIDALDLSGIRYTLLYRSYVLDSETAGYTYFMTNLAGGVTDPFGPTNRQFKFSTKDVNNQPCCCTEHAIGCKGGWWYSCSTSVTVIAVVLNGAGSCGFYWAAPPLFIPTVLKYSTVMISQA